MQEVRLASGKTFAAILAAGAVLGTVSAKTIPTDTTFRADRPWRSADPEDYPEIVAVTYDAVSGPYFAPRAYTAVAPVIRHAAATEIDEVTRIDDYAVAEPSYLSLDEAMESHGEDVGGHPDEIGDEQMIVEDY